MTGRFQYRFVRLESREAKKYQETIHEYAAEGWRLVQILAPGAGGPWAKADYFELILEQEINR